MAFLHNALSRFEDYDCECEGLRALSCIERSPTLRFLDDHCDTQNFSYILSTSNDSLSAVSSSLPFEFGDELFVMEDFHAYFHTIHHINVAYSHAHHDEIILLDAYASYSNFHTYIYQLPGIKAYFFELDIHCPGYKGWLVLPGIEFTHPPSLQSVASVTICDNTDELAKLPLPSILIKELFKIKGKFGAYIEKVVAPRARVELCVRSSADGYHPCDHNIISPMGTSVINYGACACEPFSKLSLSPGETDVLDSHDQSFSSTSSENGVSETPDPKPEAQVGGLLNVRFSLWHTDFNMQDLLSGIRNQIADKVSDPKTLSTILGLVSNFAVVYQYPSKLTLTNCVINLLNMFDVSQGLIEQLMSALAPYIQDAVDMFVRRPQAQSLSDLLSFNVDNIGTIGPILLGLLSVITLSRVPSTSSLSRAFSFAGTLGRAVAGVTALVTILPTFCLHLYDVFHTWMYGVPRDMTQFEQFEDVATKIFSRIATLSKMDNIEELRTNAALRKEVADLRFKANLVFSNLLKTKVTPQTISVYRTYLNRIEELAKRCEIHGGSMRGPRREPLCVLFAGASGKGKSQLPLFVATDLLAADGVDIKNMKDVVEEVYVRNTQQKYYNGYHGQTVFVYDDFGQVRDSESSPNEEYIEIIKSQNMFEYPLHMADLLEKNNTFFVSKAIILTSNTMNHNIKSLTCAEAFNRRVHLRYEVVIDRDCADGKGMMDPEKAKAKYGESTFKAWSFQPYREDIFATKKGTYVRDGPLLTFDQMRAEVVGKFLKQMEHSEQMFERIGNYAQYVNSNPVFTPILKNSKPKAQIQLSLIESLGIVHWRDGGLDPCYFKEKVDYDLACKALSHIKDAKNLHDFLDSLHLMDFPEAPMTERWEYMSGSVEEYYISYDSNMLPYTPAEYDPSLSLKSIRDYFMQLCENTMYKTIAGAFAAISVIYGGYKLFSCLFSSSNESTDGVSKALEEILNAEANPSGDSTTRTVARPRVEANPSGDSTTRTISRPRTEQKPNAHAYIDNNAVEIIQHKITANLYSMAANDGGDSDTRVYADVLFITNRIILMNEHVWKSIQNRKFMILKNKHRPNIPPIDISRCTHQCIVGADGEEKDACLVHLPAQTSHRTIHHLFATSTELSQFNSARCVLVGYHELHSKPAFKVNVVVARGYDNLIYSYGKNDINLRRSYRYEAFTSFGDCGSVLVAQEPKLARKILGIHVAGSTGIGYANSLTEQDILRTLGFFPHDRRVECYTPSIIEDPVYAQNGLPPGDFIPYGRVAIPATLPIKGDIYPSPLQDVIVPHKQLPSALVPFKTEAGEFIRPIQKGLAKCGASYAYVDPDLLELARRDLLNVMNTNTDPAYKRLLTHEEMIMGSSDLEFINPVKRRSSPGYGWTNKQFGKPGKTRWLGDSEYILDDPELLEALNIRESLALKGVRHEHLWHDTLKVERRPIEKVLAGKTRVFSMGQMDYNLLFRKYFLGFNANTMKYRIGNEVAVGITPQSHEWSILVEHLTRFGDNVFAGDFTNYDGSLNPQVMWACLDLINDWYDDGYDNRLVRNVLFEDIASSIHVCGDIAYGWTHSQPSGNPLTTILNSLYNSLSMRVVYYMALRDHDKSLNPIAEWHNNISMISYGDDNVVGVRPGHFFNQAIATRYYAEIGMTYTDEAKTGEICEMRKIRDVTFLKRGFLMDGGTWYSPLSLDTILEMIQWVRGTMDQEQSCSENVETAFEELAYHPREVFDKWTTLIRHHSNKLRPAPKIYSFEQYRDFFYSPRSKTYSSSDEF